MPSLTDPFEVTIDSLAFGGDGVARYDGKVVFVPGAVPGDRLAVTTTKSHRSYLRAEIQTIIEPSQHRRPAPCEHFGTCGGCQWQHVTYSQQAEQKSRIVNHILHHLNPEVIKPMTQAPQEFGYRRRVRFQWSTTGAQGDGVTLGFFRGQSHHVLNVTNCPLLTDSLRQAAQSLRVSVLQKLRPNRGTLLLLQGEHENVHFSLHCENECMDDVVEFPIGAPIVGGVWITPNQQRTYGDATVLLSETPDGGALLASAEAFTQANADQERLLRRRVVSWANAQNCRVLELYAGIGTFSWGLAQNASHFTAVESSPVAVPLLRYNVREFSAKCECHQADAADAVQSLVYAGKKFDVVVLDPPRQGAADVVALLPRLNPDRIVYISCDPMTLNRDLNELLRCGYKVTQVQAQDMMPQTFHIETLVLLSK